MTVKVAPPSGLLSAAMVPPCASTIRRAIVRPMPSPCDFVVTNGENSLATMSARKPGPVSRTETSTSVAVTLLLIVIRRRAGGVSAIASMALITRLTSTCCKSTGSPLMTQGFEGRLTVDLDLPRSHIVSHEGKAFSDDGPKIDRFLL